MPRIHSPRHGSMQFWPRVRAKRQLARVRSWSNAKDLLGFIGYKAGMTHVIAIDTKKTSPSKGEEIFVPVTVVECPPMKIAGIRIYSKKYLTKQPFKDLLFKLDKHLSRKIRIPKKTHDLSTIDSLDTKNIVDIRLIVYTQPYLAGVDKKKPDLMEIAIGGTLEEKIRYVKEHYDKEISLNQVFKEGDFVDVHAVTKGKGYQGSIKRFGVALKPHKTEKGIRRVGTLGAWSGQGHTLYRVPHPGQMGYHLRTEYNKQIFKISNNVNEINPKGAFIKYGNVKSTYILLAGSIPGVRKRAIVITKPLRNHVATPLPTIVSINKDSKQ